MKVKIKKLWILYDYTEKIEGIEKEYDESFVGNTYVGMYSNGIGASEGTYMIIPVDCDIEMYRKNLILYMIEKEQTEIKIANNKIEKLVDILFCKGDDKKW